MCSLLSNIKATLLNFSHLNKKTQSVVEALEQYAADYGAPEGIVLDNGGEFTSNTFQKFCQNHVITLYYTTLYHPQGNDVMERIGYPMPGPSPTVATSPNLPGHYEHPCSHQHC